MTLAFRILMVVAVVIITAISIVDETLPDEEDIINNQTTNILIYIIFHDDNSRKSAFQSHFKFSNITRPIQIPSTRFFESIAYKEVFPNRYEEWKDKDYVGMMSYKVAQRYTCSSQLLDVFNNISFSIHDTKMSSKLDIQQLPYDFIPMFIYGIKKGGDHQELVPDGMALHGHESFAAAWTKLLEKMNYTKTEINRLWKVRPFYRNAFICKPTVLVKLMDFMGQAMDIALSDKSIYNLLSIPTSYADWDVAVAQKVFKKNYYENFPFFFERLPAFLIHSLNISIYWHAEPTELALRRCGAITLNGHP